MGLYVFNWPILVKVILSNACWLEHLKNLDPTNLIVSMKCPNSKIIAFVVYFQKLRRDM